MSVSSPFILRPVATSLLGVAVLLAGLMGFWKLSVAPLPQVDFPTIQITTQMPGANPDTIAVIITAPLERQFGQIPSLTTMSSVSSFGLSQITLQFDLDRDIDGAAQDVQSAINGASSTLPRGLPYPPVYSKVNPADTPILTLALTAENLPLRTLSDFADSLIGPRLSEISGVGRVSIQGGIKPAVRIQADLARLANYKISLEDLRVAIVAANVAGAKGAMDGAQQAYTIATNDQIAAAAAYSAVVIAYRNGAPVLLRDVAEVTDGLENTRVSGWYKGETAIILDVQRQPGANVITTVDRLKQEIPRIARSVPAGAKLDIVHDRTQMIRASIHEVEATLALSVALVVLVVLLFLRTVRATIIAGITLPLSIIATFAVMWLAGFSLDNLSLMALTIGTGFIVDDAIVMIENIVRNLDLGKSPLRAALDGAREISFTVISLTFSLIAVFIPLLFMTGVVGRMFREFALTLAISVIVSAIVSLTLTPMLCAKILRERAPGRDNPLMRLAEWPMNAMARIYETTLGWALRAQGFMLLVTFGTLLLTVWLYVIAPKGFLPAQDTGLISVNLESSPDVSFTEMSRLQNAVAAELARDPEVTGVSAVLGIGPLNATSNVARLTVVLRDRDVRTQTAAGIAERLRLAGSRVAGARIFVEPVQDIQISTRASRSQYQYTLAGVNGGDINEWAAKLAERLRRDDVMRNVAAETYDGGLRVFVDVQREKAGRLGVTMQQIDDTLNSAFGQRQISTIYAQSNQYRVILEAAPQFRNDPSSLGKLFLPGAGGAPTPLSSVANITRTTAPLAVIHQDQFPAAVISFDLAPHSSLGDAVEEVARASADINLPGAITGSFSADAAEFERSLATQPWLILAAVVTIYLVLGVLYESFAHPFTILTTLPSAGVGALLALRLFGYDLSVVALIGIVLLMGIVKKNAIMMIDFALEAERHEGLSPTESIVRACRLRFRPIMMTTLAALFGALPLALASGTGSELRTPLGVTIIGGLLLSQLLTLFTTPVIYLQVERLRAALGAGRKAPDEADAPIPAAEAAP